MNKHLSEAENILLNKICLTLTHSELVVQQTFSILVERTHRISDIKSKIIKPISETSIREAILSLLNKKLLTSIKISDKSYYSLTMDGSHISPFVKKRLTESQAQLPLL